MTRHDETHARTRTKEDAARGGMPGDGAGRREDVRGSGVYPMSGPLPEEDAPVETEAAWGQGASGPAGYDDSGTSEVIPPGGRGDAGEGQAATSDRDRA